MSDDLVKRLHKWAGFGYRADASRVMMEAAARIAEVEADRDAMMSALAECRDAMPIPESGAELEGHWVSAMADPLEVPGFIKAHMAATVAPAVDAQAVAKVHRPGCEALGGYGHGIGPCDCGAEAQSEGLRKDAVRREALEEAAKVCDEISIDRWKLYKGRAPYTGSECGRADSYVAGESDGAEKCAAAIRALKDPQ